MQEAVRREVGIQTWGSESWHLWNLEVSIEGGFGSLSAWDIFRQEVEQGFMQRCRAWVPSLSPTSAMALRNLLHAASCLDAASTQSDLWAHCLKAFCYITGSEMIKHITYHFYQISGKADLCSHVSLGVKASGPLQTEGAVSCSSWCVEGLMNSSRKQWWSAQGCSSSSEDMLM